MVPGKSLAIISLTGQVWHPMGMPSGLARSSEEVKERNPAAAALVAAFLTNSLLEIAGMVVSLFNFSFITRDSLQFPSAAAFRADELLRGIGVNDLQAGAIPIEFLSHASGDISQEQSLRDEAREFEISTGLDFASLAGVEPFAFVARRPWQSFWRLFVAIHFRFGDEPWIGAIECAENLAAISNEKEPFAAFFVVPLEVPILFQFLAARRLEAAVIPREFPSRHVAAGPEVGRGNRGELQRFFVALGGARFDAHGRLQLQSAKNSIETVGTHIAQS